MTTLVVGVGHADRGDDAAGLAVVARLRGSPHLTARAASGDLCTLLVDPAWQVADHVVLVDSVRTGARPGTIHRWGVAEVLERLPVGSAGLHDLGVAETVRLAHMLDRLPDDLTVVGIEVGDVVLGTPPSPAVRAAAGTVATQLERQALAAASEHPG